MEPTPLKIFFAKSGGLTGVQPPILNSGGLRPPNPPPCLAPLNVALYIWYNDSVGYTAELLISQYKMGILNRYLHPMY